MKKTCPRCHTDFECLHDEMLQAWQEQKTMPQCQCMQVQLSNKARKYIHDLYQEQCLCANCLRDVAELMAATGDE